MRLHLASCRADAVAPLLYLAGPGARAVVVSNALAPTPTTAPLVGEPLLRH
ncbi:MAG: hypothetical protein V4759_07720 [Pseudomonadota bacterium]